MARNKHPMLTTSGVAGIAVILLGVATIMVAIKSSRVQDVFAFGILDTKAGFDPGKATEELLDMTDTARAAYRSFLMCDFFFLITYAGALSGAACLLSRGKSWRLLLAAIPVGAGLVDFIEDVAIWLLLDARPTTDFLRVVRWVGVVKFVLLATSLVIVLFLALEKLLDKVPDKLWAKTGHEDGTERTYFALRFALTTLVFVLGAAILVHWARYEPRCFQTSISAYYHTTIQGTFIAVLCAVGICLIVYQGSTKLENFLLDIAGFMAFVVALEPTGSDKYCEGRQISTSAEIDAGPHDNLAPLLGVAICATLFLLGKWFFKAGLNAARNAAAVRLALNFVVLVAMLVLLLAWPTEFEHWGHGTAAVLLFICIIAVVWANHRGYQAEKKTAEKKTKAADIVKRNLYAVVLVAMVVSLLLCLATVFIAHWEHVVIVLEGSLILEFAAFWAIQTWDLRWRAARSKVDSEQPVG